MNNETIRPNKKLGQFFLKDNLVLVDIIDSIKHCSSILEIGAGTGNLTKILAPLTDKLIAVEIDKRLIPILQKELHKEKNTEIIQADFLKYEIPSVDLIIGNIPYYISSPIIFKLAANSNKFSRVILMFQKEFVEHLLASPGTDGWSRLAVTSQHFFKMKKLRDIHGYSFWPAVEIDSTLVELIPTHKKLTDKQNFIITLLFQHKNQTVRNALIHSHRALGITKEDAKKLKVPFIDKRPKELEIEQILKIADSIKSS